MRPSSILASTLYISAAYAFAPSSTIETKPSCHLSLHHTKTINSSTTTTLQMSSDTKSPFDFLSGLFPQDDNKSYKVTTKLPDAVIDPDFNIAFAFGGVGLLIILITQGSVYGFVQGGITLLFASFLAVQATRIRFVFDETSFELKTTSSDEDLQSSGENIVVGGENRWRYDSFVNYDFFPNRGLPILVYFKENQTPQDKWNEGPGMLDKKGGGQLHFFPAIANVDQLKEQFALRGCAKIEE